MLPSLLYKAQMAFEANLQPTGQVVVTIDAGRQMAEMERVFGAAGNRTRQMVVAVIFLAVALLGGRGSIAIP